ncbi:MAG: nucleoside-diphosphate-sugar epimerase [Proteobacteria bacterium]|nr:nucleoside-diphosphate-sugar epimerase [Pseudomonadota bacterium]
MNTTVISASMVLYKPDLLAVERALLALQKAGQLAGQQYAIRLELTLVDNSDDSILHAKLADWLEGFRAVLVDWSVQLLRAPGNVGYGRGNNLVIASARSDYHAVVNPDLFVAPEALLEALRFMEAHGDVGLLSPAVFGEDGERHYLCKRNPTLLIMFLRSFSPKWLQRLSRFIIDKFEMRDCDYERAIHPLEYPTGCFMFFRTAPLQTIGGFDPDYFLHYEDADIGRRMLKVARVVYVPTVRVVHRWARDTHRSLQSMLITVRSGWLYWRKWGGVLSSKSATEQPSAAPLVGECSAPGPETGSGRRVLVTGANGFIGQAVCADLPSRGYRVLAAVRRPAEFVQQAGTQCVVISDIDEHTDWSAALSGVDSVVHLAARVHLMRETAANPLAEFRSVNVALTLNLARQAAVAGVRRFVFVSSVKVNGESTPFGQPFTADDVPRPLDDYGVSKFEAEQALLQLAEQTGMELVIIRPPLVYGPGVKANFQMMLHWLGKGVPLPLGALDKPRSFVGLGNLVDLIATCLTHRAAANQIFLVSDGEDLTVSALLQRTAAALCLPVRLLPVPLSILRIGGWIFGKDDIFQRLCDTLQVDIEKTRCLLGWEPPISVDAELRKTAQRKLGE